MATSFVMLFDNASSDCGLTNGGFETGDDTGWSLDDINDFGESSIGVCTDGASSGTYGVAGEISDGEPLSFENMSALILTQSTSELSNISSVSFDICFPNYNLDTNQSISIDLQIMDYEHNMWLNTLATYDSDNLPPSSWITVGSSDIPHGLSGSGLLLIAVYVSGETSIPDTPACTYSKLADHPTNGGFELGDFTEWDTYTSRDITAGASSGVLVEAASSGTYGAKLYAQAPQRVYYRNYAGISYDFQGETQLLDNEFCKIKLRINVPHLAGATGNSYNRVAILIEYTSEGDQ